jgi:sulfoxide reductase heme-binding subunit YedZ
VPRLAPLPARVHRPRIIAAYLAAILGLSFYVRGRVGTKRRRSLHRLTLLVYVLGVIHALGAGTDASTPWMQATLPVTGTPTVFLLALLRWLPGRAPASRPAPARRSVEGAT